MAKKSIITYAALNKNYPDSAGHINGGCEEYNNQCAIRMSRALALSGLPLANYNEPVCRADNITHARGAEELAGHLRKVIGPPKILGSASQTLITGKKGIVFFKDIIGFRDGRGDHIDLWNGTKTRGYNGFGHCTQVWFWELND